jgi:HprK-related kinase B
VSTFVITFANFTATTCGSLRSKPRSPSWVFHSRSGRAIRRRARAHHGLAFLLGTDLSLAVGACADNQNQIANLIHARYIERLLQRGWLLCHAAGVAMGTRGIALCGPSDSGKSTVALRAIGGGASYVASHGLLVHETGGARRMAGVPEWPRVNPGTLVHDSVLRTLLSEKRLSELEKLSATDLWRLQDKHDIDIGRLFGPSRMLAAADLLACVVLNWSSRSIRSHARGAQHTG